LAHDQRIASLPIYTQFSLLPPSGAVIRQPKKTPTPAPLQRSDEHKNEPFPKRCACMSCTRPVYCLGKRLQPNRRRTPPLAAWRLVKE